MSKILSLSARQDTELSSFFVRIETKWVVSVILHYFESIWIDSITMVCDGVWS